MIQVIILVLYTLALLLVSLLYVKKRYKIDIKRDIQGLIRHHLKFKILTIFVFLAAISIETFYITNNDISHLPAVLKWSTLFWGLFLLALIDWKEKCIPNLIVFSMLVIRLLFLIYELFASSGYWKNALVYPLLGAALGAGIMAIAMVVSRHGLGMGDVKLFLMIGMYVGSSEIISTLFYTCIASALFGVILLITRRAKLKDSFPLAPFAFLGVAVEYVLLMIGG